MPKKIESEIHRIHPYPCKFPSQVVRQFIGKNRVILDPFCGSGTTLVEAAINGSTSIGVDCNPIAILISKCKLTNLNTNELNMLSNAIELLNNSIAKDLTEYHLHEFEGKDHWFKSEVQNEIAFILDSISKWKRDSSLWTVSSTALSSITNIISYQDSETRYARREKSIQKGQVIDLFTKKLNQIIKAIIERGEIASKPHQLLQANIIKDKVLKEESVDVVITSPPYANTMDYYLYHKQRMNLLGYSFKETLKNEIGSRHEFSSKKADVSKWNNDFKLFMSEIYRALKNKSKAIIVLGDSQINGKLISGAKITENIAIEIGFKFKLLESVSMTGKSKLFNSSFQRPNKYEHTIELTK